MRTIPNFTRIAIKNAFLKLLRDKPLNKISVKDIVEECGINRNSFYYHFQDVPTLLEAIVMEQADAIIADFSPADPIRSCLSAAFDFAEKNRSIVLHVYRYMDREVFESYLWNVCEHIVTAYAGYRFVNSAIPSETRALVVRIYKWQFFGLVIDWLNDGMPTDDPSLITSLSDLNENMIADFERRCKYGK